MAPATIPSSFPRGHAGGPQAPRCLPGLEESQEAPRQSGRKHRIIRGQVSVPPVRATGLGGRDCSVPCVIVLLKDYLFLSPSVTGATAWGRGGGRAEGAPHFISKVLHLCDGVGWGRNDWCYRSRGAPPPRPANVPFCLKSFFYSLGFFLFCFVFPCGWGLVNFLKVLLNLGGESVATQCSLPPLSAPPPAASLHLSL